MQNQFDFHMTFCAELYCLFPVFHPPTIRSLHALSAFIRFIYNTSRSHTPPIIFSRKQKGNPRMSRGRKNVSSSSERTNEQSENAQHWKDLAKRSSPCCGQSIKISNVGRHSCLNFGQTSTFFFSAKPTQTNMSPECQCFCMMYIQHGSGFVYVYCLCFICLYQSACTYSVFAYTCLYDPACLCLMVCVCSVHGATKRPGLRPQDNKTPWMIQTGQSGRHRLCPRETQWEILANSGQLWVRKIKTTHNFCEQRHKIHWFREQIRKAHVTSLSELWL